MQYFVSDLVFPAFNKPELAKLAPSYGLEIFNEFGTEPYWNVVLPRLGVGSDGRRLTFHGPCVSLNLADPHDALYRVEYKDTFRLAAALGARHVVIHTNEALLPSQKTDAAARHEAQEQVRSRLEEIIAVAESVRRERSAAPLGNGEPFPLPVVENVGLHDNMLFNEEEYIDLIRSLPSCAALLDLGHAHVNGWNLVRVIAKLQGHLVSYHVHDNDGTGDRHLPVGRGTIPWKEVIAAMHQYTPKADVVFEYANGTFPDAAALADHLATIRNAFETAQL